MANKFSSRFQSFLGARPNRTDDEDSANNAMTSSVSEQSVFAPTVSLPEFQVVAGVLKKYNGYAEDVVVPSDMGIQSIGQRAFFKCTTIKTIKLPTGLNSIGNYAFSGCENMTHISIPSTLSAIGNYAFENCKNLVAISLPDVLNSVGNYLFSGCSSLYSVTLPENLRTVSNYMFFKCTSLTTITLNEKVAGIGWKAFSGCTSLSEIIFPKRLNTLGNYAFENCTSLTTVTLTANISNIGEGVFFLCENLRTIEIEPNNIAFVIENGVLYNSEKTLLYIHPSKLDTNGIFEIPYTVRTICYGAFSNCLDITRINIPTSVTSIENYAFFNCINLNGIQLHDNITTIGKSAFHKCINLTSIHLPKSINQIDSGTFSGCENLKEITIPSGCNSIGEIAFYGCSSLENIDIPTSVVSIGRSAFSNCNSITTIKIHSMINHIDKGAFSHCNNLTTLSVSSDNMNYMDVDGVLYSKSGNHLITYPAGRKDETFVIPETVSKISDQAFFGSNNLTNITIPKTVTSIGISSFSDCIKLQVVYVEEGLISLTTFAFSKCISLECITLPNSLDSIDGSAFTECGMLCIKCFSNSKAHSFAIENEIPYELMDNAFNPIDTSSIMSVSYETGAMPNQTIENVPAEHHYYYASPIVSVKNRHKESHLTPSKASISYHGDHKDESIVSFQYNETTPSDGLPTNAIDVSSYNNYDDSNNSNNYNGNDNRLNSDTNTIIDNSNTIDGIGLERNSGNNIGNYNNSNDINNDNYSSSNSNSNNAKNNMNNFNNKGNTMDNNTDRQKIIVTNESEPVTQQTIYRPGTGSLGSTNPSININKAIRNSRNMFSNIPPATKFPVESSGLKPISKEISLESIRPENTKSEAKNKNKDNSEVVFYEDSTYKKFNGMIPESKIRPNHTPVSSQTVSENIGLQTSSSRNVSEQLKNRMIQQEKQRQKNATADSPTLNINFNPVETTNQESKKTVSSNNDLVTGAKSVSQLNSKLYNEKLKTSHDTQYNGRITNLNSAPNTATSMFLYWDEFIGASEYHILKYNRETKAFDDVDKLKTCKAIISGLFPGSEEQYQIMAYKIENNTKIPCAVSKTITLSVTLPPVTGLQCSGVSTNTITLSWDEYKDAVRYVVYAYKMSERKFCPIEETTKTSITLSNIKGGTTLRLKVAAIKILSRKECPTSMSDEIFATTDMPPVTGVIMASHTSNSIKLNWISVNGANAYKIYLYNSQNGKYEYVATSKENNIQLQNLAPNMEYLYRIRACKITNGKEFLGPPSAIIRANTFL